MAKLFCLCLLGLFALANAAPQTRPERPPRGNSSSTTTSTTNRPSPSIILGSPAQEGEIPFQALLFSANNGSEFGFDCGGSLIHPNWVLTAAHCLPDTQGTLVEMGSVDRFGMTYSEWSYERYPHEQYDDFTLVNDIALIKLSRPASGRNIATVELADASLGSLEGDTTTASGFGLTTNDGQESDVLLKVDLTTISNQQCNSFYGNINDGQICTVYSMQVGESTCEGDSGGPLFHTATGTTYLVGITSFGSDRGCDADVPSAYTRVSAFRDWIQRTMDANP